MKITNRTYNLLLDYERVSDFLLNNYSGKEVFSNWLQPRWEYMHFHSIFDISSTCKNRIWEVSGDIVAVVHYELRLGEAFFQVKQGYESLKEEMLLHAQEHLYKETIKGKELKIIFNTDDKAMINLADKYGFIRDYTEWDSIYHKDKPINIPSLPSGFKMISLAQEKDSLKLIECMHRGFNHGEPTHTSATDIFDKDIMINTPNFNDNLNIAIVDQNSDYASYSGVWYDKQNKIGYIEPVCTVPKHRRKGLGKVAVLECVKRCIQLGAERIYVGSSQEFYLAIGFEKLFTRDVWKKVYK